MGKPMAQPPTSFSCSSPPKAGMFLFGRNKLSLVDESNDF